MDWLTFHVERLLLRGAHYRLLFMAGAVAAVACFGGLGLVVLGEPESFSDASWWAFLRLTDPGYLGDDDGVARRTLSTVITVAGYVLFMGALIAILTQWLHETVARLQRGETPIVMKDHILVLGLTPQTPLLLEEIMRSEARVELFLSRRGASGLRLVVLVEELDERIRAELSERLGEFWDDSAIMLRSGSPLIAEHLDRVDFARASVVLVPGGADPGEKLSGRDADTVKTMLSIANHPRIRDAAVAPRLVAEVFDARLIDIVQSVYRGPIELIPSEANVSRLIAQNLRHGGLSWVLSEILAFHSGNDIYYPSLPELDGQRFTDVVLRLRGGVALGVVRRDPTGAWQTVLAPPPEFCLQPGDRLVVIAKALNAVTVHPPSTPLLPAGAAAPPVGRTWPANRRVLVLGWSRRIPPLVAELDSYDGEDFTVDVVAIVPVENREQAIRRVAGPVLRTDVRHLTGDYTNVSDIAALDIGSYDNVLILGRGWMLDGESSDAQTILAYSIVHSFVNRLERRPSILVELTDPDNSNLFEDRPGELVLSPVFMARILAHVAVRPELVAILDELFTAGGAEFHYRPLADFGLQPGTHRFAELQAIALSHQEQLVGVRVSDVAIDVRSDLSLAPTPDTRFDLRSDSLLLVLTTRAVIVGGV